MVLGKILGQHIQLATLKRVVEQLEIVQNGYTLTVSNTVIEKKNNFKHVFDELFENRSKAKTETFEWISVIKADLDAAGTKQTDIKDGENFRHNVFGCELRQREKHKKAGTNRSEERKEAHRERTKQMWVQRKAHLLRRLRGVFRVVQLGPYENSNNTNVLFLGDLYCPKYR